MATGKKTAGLPGAAGKKAPTVEKPTGTVAPVTNPLDLWYLCEKVNYALKYPLKRSDGQMMYQRGVTKLIRKDDRNFNYHFPYIGEVGYDMTLIPPQPLMSRNPLRRNWPSSFPLAQYHLVKRGYSDRLLNKTEGKVERILELLTRDELERLPKPGRGDVVFDDALDVILKRRGSFRIPDVIRLKDFTLTGKPAFSQGNIETVIEIKFPGDRLKKEQRDAYEDIAGDEDKFRLLETHVCQVDDKRKREWIRDSVQEPVYKPVADALGETEQICLRPDVPAWKLLEGEMEQEFSKVREYFNPWQDTYVPPDGMPVYTLRPPRDAYEVAREARDYARAGGYLGAVMAGPVVLVPAGAAAGSAVAAIGEALIGSIAGTAVQYARTAATFFIAAGSTELAMASEDKALPSHTSSAEQFLDRDFVWWPD